MSDTPERVSDKLRPAFGRYSCCPICGSDQIAFAAPVDGNRIEECAKCGLLFFNPQPDEKEHVAIRGQASFAECEKPSPGSATIESSQIDLAATKCIVCHYLRTDPENLQEKRIVAVGFGRAFPGETADTQGLDITEIDLSHEANDRWPGDLRDHPALPKEARSRLSGAGCFNVCVLSHAIERVRNPGALIKSVWELLRPGGMVLVASRHIRRVGGWGFRNPTPRFSLGQLFYFTPTSLQAALYTAGFSAVRMYSPPTIGGPEVLALRQNGLMDDGAIKSLLVKLGAGRSWNDRPDWQGHTMVAAATKDSDTPRRVRKLSVILPVYNEKDTFPVLMKQLIAKDLPGMEMEIVVVESNSTDGTKDEVLKLKDNPRVKIVLQDGPRGKGNAVREGLEHASGDIILIQDGDLEYDPWDYEAVIREIVHLRRSFTLGVRYGAGSVTMRKFPERRFMALYVNLGHRLMTLVLNRLFGKTTKDPWTMFKAFRSDCLRGVDFECDHFDFDAELVIKLIQQGFDPLDIPVHYESRSFAQGKKVSLLLDPLRILKTMFKLRFFQKSTCGNRAYPSLRATAPKRDHKVCRSR